MVLKGENSIIITNGLVITRDNILKGAIRIADGLIEKVGDIPSTDKDEVVDAAGCHIAPAIIDFNVFAVDMKAAHFGGIARVGLMPDLSTPLDLPSRVSYICGTSYPDLRVHPLAAATKGLEGKELAEIALMKQAGAKAVSTGRSWISDSGVMLRLMQYAAMLDMVVISHPEDAGLVGSGVATAGEMATRLGLPSAPVEAEVLAVARDLALAEMSEARVHFRQITTASSLNLIRSAKARGVSVTAGITPAHFMLSDLATSDFRTFARLSPPLRSEADRMEVLAAIADGTIDVVSSGHDPKGPEQKRQPFSDAEPGMVGAQTLLPLVLTLVRDKVIDLNRAFDLLAKNPATLLGVNAGEIVVGREADITLINAEKPWVIDGNKMPASARNTPFDGHPVQGRACKLWVGGQKASTVSAV